jgi:D-alanine-D-alanine ligase-like ATP-grasp enzyme
MHWITPGFETLELSTQLVIAEALRRGHSVDVLDPAANIIRIHGRGKTEYLQQATRTSADTYVSPLLMENKQVTKLLLDEAGLRTPAGRAHTERATLSAEYPRWKERGAVVKPNTTNFGIAVTLLPAPIAEGDFRAAGERAFAEDGTVLVEELLGGEEYRLLVIGDAVRGVLQRVPAHVTGDGRHTVAELIAIKNEDPRRGKGYHSPLERIRQGAEEAERLAAQGLGFDSSPEAGREVWLRRNSNISTGGDSLDLTDEIHPGYRDLAVAAAAAVGAQICGVDMLIDDLTAEPTGHNYGIIELNFNPALHIHDFPFRGRNRQVERHVLDLLGL